MTKKMEKVDENADLHEEHNADMEAPEHQPVIDRMHAEHAKAKREPHKLR